MPGPPQRPDNPTIAAGRVALSRVARSSIRSANMQSAPVSAASFLSALLSASSRVFFRPLISFSKALMRFCSSESSSITMIPAMTVMRWSPISPNEALRCET